MKVEKISPNKFKLTFSDEDLKDFGVDFENIRYNSEDAQELFWELIERAEIEEEKLTGEIRDADGEKLYVVHIEGLEEGGHRETRSMTKADILTAILRVNKMLDQIGCITLNELRGIFDLAPVEGGEDVGWSVDMLCDWWQSYQLDFTIDDMSDGSLLIFPMFCAYGGYLTDYGLDY